MKINRVKDTERYSITSDWLNDFANNITKQSNYLDRIMERRDNRVEEKFATIEEKMVDIRQRIGFVNKKENNSINKEASPCGEKTCEPCSGKYKDTVCACGTCNMCIRDNAREYVINILQYIKSMLASEPHLMPVEVISRCRNDYPKFSSYESMMDYDKLKGYIQEMRSPKSIIKFDHIPKEEIHNFTVDEDGIAN